MSRWQLNVHRAGEHTEVRLRHDSGLCRGWSGDMACRLCHSLGLDSGEHACPKQRAWQLFLLAHAIEETRDENWQERLRLHGLVPTPTRTTIATFLLKRAQHVTAEGLEAALQRAGQRISRRRVRKTLDEFVEWDLLQKVDVGGGVVFYDTVTSPHAHVYNVDTGTLEDLRPDQAWITGLPELPDGMRLDGVQLVFRVRQVPDVAAETP